MTRSLVQVAQRVEDLDRAVDFYASVLGLRVIARFGEAQMAFLDLGGGTRLLLGQGHHPSSLYLAVDDIDAAHGELVDAGVTFEVDPRLVHTDRDGHFGTVGTEEWMAFFGDTEGNLVAIVERREPPGAT